MKYNFKNHSISEYTTKYLICFRRDRTYWFCCSTSAFIPNDTYLLHEKLSLSRNNSNNSIIIFNMILKYILSRSANFEHREQHRNVNHILNKYYLYCTCLAIESNVLGVETLYRMLNEYAFFCVCVLLIYHA